ncbi:Protease synthase and sporulation protein PAI 2 [Marinomonas aquimarina]|uniref:Protease synthase and sporulation protein PAI 2 n=1 Tax=Marinomonas aquimarina TaxID=295068 RepID=A0A1A8THT5_9GAMM|nr:FMN-binding negative transcriptional regulator [Marinomonas aquimarina]SBS32269.1 Protease synthase and sporulation protein PAI 2 [Marinomonas aquimarina]
MYVPTHFKEEDHQVLQQYIRDYSCGTLIISDAEGIEANHVPFYLAVNEDSSLGKLQCHLARANPAWQRIQDGAQVLAVFQGPNAYISPSWYATKAETGRVVPTWNYLAVHVQGKAQVIQDPDWLKQHLHQLTDQHEASMEEPWSVADAPTDFTDRLVKAIVGIEIRIESLTGKLKASQNQPQANRESVRASLQGLDDVNSAAVAKLVD